VFLFFVFVGVIFRGFRQSENIKVTNRIVRTSDVFSEVYLAGLAKLWLLVTGV